MTGLVYGYVVKNWTMQTLCLAIVALWASAALADTVKCRTEFQGAPDAPVPSVFGVDPRIGVSPPLPPPPL